MAKSFYLWKLPEYPRWEEIIETIYQLCTGFDWLTLAYLTVQILCLIMYCLEPMGESLEGLDIVQDVAGEVQHQAVAVHPLLLVVLGRPGIDLVRFAQGLDTHLLGETDYYLSIENELSILLAVFPNKLGLICCFFCF